MHASADGSAKIAYHQVCVLFDSSSGEIVSVFESITLEGGSAPDSEEIEERARMQSSEFIQARSGRPFDDKNVQTILVGPEEFQKPGPKRVDLKSLTLVAAEG